MKKLFFTLTVLATMASCSNDELVEVTPKQAITFGNAFVDNATRAIDNSYTNANLKQFNVYGTVTGSTQDKNIVNIFNGNSVTGDVGQNTWIHTGGSQYWIEGAMYNFTAIAGVANDKGVAQNVTVDKNDDMPTKISYDASTQKDLLYAKSSEITGQKVGENSDVNFSFNHILSKVHFTVKNTMTTSGVYAYQVKDIEILNAAKNADFEISSESWGTATTSYSEADPLKFGHVTTTESANAAATSIEDKGNSTDFNSATSNYARLLIPATYSSTNKLKIKFTKDLLMRASSTDEYQVIHTETIDDLEVDVTLEKGHAYNFVISLGNPGDEIKFKVTNGPSWDTNHNSDDTDDDETPIYPETQP